MPLEPLTAKRLAEIREVVASEVTHFRKYGHAYSESMRRNEEAIISALQDLLNEIDRPRVPRDEQADYGLFTVGMAHERQTVITWLKGDAGRYLSKGREGHDLAEALARNEHHKEVK